MPLFERPPLETLAPALALLFVTAPAVEAINVPRKSPELAARFASAHAGSKGGSNAS